jgi:hypothetical protein
VFDDDADEMRSFRDGVLDITVTVSEETALSAMLGPDPEFLK